MIDQPLLRALLRAYAAQPATAVWRAIEIGALLRVGIPQGRGLDFGCGDGKLTAILLNRTGPRQLIGIDPDPLETREAELSGVYEAVHSALGDAIPEPDRSFDFVIANSVLEHIPDLAPVLAEIARVLRPGGQFFFTVPGPGFHRNLRGSLLPWASRRQYLEELDRRLAHLRYPTASEWMRACLDAGLTVESCLGYLDRADIRTWETLSRFTGGLLYALWGKRQSPIRIQRKLGLRSVQNRLKLPAPAAWLISKLVGAHLRKPDAGWLPEAEAGCLLVHGIRA